MTERGSHHQFTAETTPVWVAPECLQNPFTLHLLGHQFHQLLNCFLLVGRIESIGNARPDEFAFCRRDRIESCLDSYFLFFFQITRTVDHRIYGAVVAVESVVIRRHIRRSRNVRYRVLYLNEARNNDCIDPVLPNLCFQIIQVELRTFWSEQDSIPWYQFHLRRWKP